ncbi:MAG TPA: SPOR domain-containing protein, partial [Paludibacteraceae bacterium]|nr:SPOR domain-containing protein [Paludibacteraceae bacterium]HRS24842.1 SPOR domain-containing protein [Paludibacteraceae bacterium]
LIKQVIMKLSKFILAFLVLSALVFALPACKSKQKVVEIPGANAKAGTSTSENQQKTTSPVIVTQPTTSTENVPEITRSESFSLAEGETNQSAMNYKYHVVVGSFRNQSNAKGLQRTLSNEGYNPVIVINEQGMFRVIMNSFNTYNEAHVFISKIQSRFPDAWVLIKK